MGTALKVKHMDRESCFKSQKFRDKRSGKVVTSFSILDVQYIEPMED